MGNDAPYPDFPHQYLEYEDTELVRDDPSCLTRIHVNITLMYTKRQRDMLYDDVVCYMGAVADKALQVSSSVTLLLAHARMILSAKVTRLPKVDQTRTARVATSVVYRTKPALHNRSGVSNEYQHLGEILVQMDTGFNSRIYPPRLCGAAGAGRR